MKISTRVELRKRMYWRERARTAVEWIATTAVIWYMVYCTVDTMFPNVPLH